MPQQSLYSACKKIYRVGSSGEEIVGNNTIDFELYTQADIDANVEAIAQGSATKCTFGDSDESKVVLVAGDTITVPSGFNLTPANPKKSLVILCNTFVNNGTVSMTGKGPNVLPHDYLLLSKFDNYGEDSNIVVLAYANNGLPRKSFAAWTTVCNGNNGNDGTNRNCGSGGQGSSYPNGSNLVLYLGTSGSGSAFAGGGGGAGLDSYSASNVRDCDTTYPMRGGSSAGGTFGADGGVGNPVGGRSTYTNVYKRTNITAQNVGVGGRLVIFCSTFTNNGTLSADGIATKRTCTSGGDNRVLNYGGASGGGAIDVFYNFLDTEGTLTAIGGGNFTNGSTPGKGGNGCVTLLEWDIEKVIKYQKKYMSKANMIYFLQELVHRINGDD